MYAGKVTEEASVTNVFDAPHHPYTQGLLASIPGRKTPRGDRLHAIAGTIPALGEMPSGCRFHPRCPFARDACQDEQPVLREIDGRFVACLRAEEPEVAAARS
jgi:oligopeptide/dipeptide ABC transporter ATP-binding protein